MKTKLRQKQLWKNIFFILSISCHIHSGLCRPTAAPNVGQESNLPNSDDAKSDVHQPKARPVYDLRHMGKSEIHSIRGERHMKNNDTLFLYTEKDSIRFVPNDVGFISDIDDAFGDETSTRDDAGGSRVIPDKGGSVPHRHQVVPFTEDRNLVRKRRQPEQHRNHRRRRRKHRRLLKARERNHLADEEEELKDQRGQPLLKSDSPGYLITNASEIKKDWCRTLPLQELVSEPDCHARIVQNNFCYGQCNSFFIPYTARTDNKEFFQSCAFCKPLRQHWGNVTLNCPGRNPPKIVKTVLFVDKCRCMTEILQ